MKKVCAWCQKSLDNNSNGSDQTIITHGICPDCRSNVVAQMGQDIESFLNTLDIPVLLVDSNVRVQTANKQARANLGQELPEVQSKLGGEIIECKNAQLPGGCGNTIHCSGCTLRRLIEKTAETGKSYEKVPATLERQSRASLEDIKYLFSTEKVGEQVLLRIDDVG